MRSRKIDWVAFLAVIAVVANGACVAVLSYCYVNLAQAGYTGVGMTNTLLSIFEGLVAILLVIISIANRRG